jgi:hypothetical protein
LAIRTADANRVSALTNVVPLDNQDQSASKMYTKIYWDLLGKIPVCDGSDPNKFWEFLIRVTSLHQLNLISESEFVNSLLIKTGWPLSQRWGEYARQGLNWTQMKGFVMNLFLLPLLHEDFVIKHMTRRFQSDDETLSEFISSIQIARDFLNYKCTETGLT